MPRFVLLCLLLLGCFAVLEAADRKLTPVAAPVVTVTNLRTGPDSLSAETVSEPAGLPIPDLFFCDTVPQTGNGLSAASDSLLERKDSVIRSKKADAKKSKTENIYKDSALQKGANPRKATILSAAFPGLGQIYNKKYWKLPLVYAAVGIPAYAFFYNKSWYKKCQYALTVTVNQSPADSVARVDKQLMPFVKANDVNGLITNRDSFRKNQDYSVLFFLLLYGLQVVDATVDAHLKGFNVNDELSLKITPSLLSSYNTVAGVSFVFDIHKPALRPLHVN